MKITPSYSYLKNGDKIINGYKLTLTKSLVEKNGFKSGDEVVAKYQEGKITITAKK